MFNFSLSIIVVFTFLASCSQRTEIREISLSSHLSETAVQEPDLIPGETIIYIPNKKDPFHSFNPVRVQVPKHNDQGFLKGYVFGFACQKNLQLQCIFGMTEFTSTELYHSGYISGCRDGMGHKKWDQLHGEYLNQYLLKPEDQQL